MLSQIVPGRPGVARPPHRLETASIRLDKQASREIGGFRARRGARYTRISRVRVAGTLGSPGGGVSWAEAGGEEVAGLGMAT